MQILDGLNKEVLLGPEGPPPEEAMLSKAQLRRRHFIGLLLAVAVVCIWVSSSVVIQMIFQDADFDKPFFLTYLSTSLFSVYLLGFAIKWRTWTANLGFPIKKRNYTTLVEEEKNKVNEIPEATGSPLTPSGYVKMTVYETLKLSAMFCPIWFVANYTYNLGLSMTSVSSNTILSTLSGVFALFLSTVMRVDTFNIWKLIAAIITLGGVAVVSLVDKDEAGEDSVLGDLYTVVGAVFYSFYCTFLKKKIAHEERLIMPMFFGFMGLINFVILWLFMIMWSGLGIETFEWPSVRVWLFLIANGLIGTVLSDMLEAWSIILTTPLINTLGLSLTIPLAMVSDVIRGKKDFSVLYLLGSFLVLVGFVLVNLSSGTFEERFAEWRRRLYNKCFRRNQVEE